MITLYTKPNCEYCQKAKALLNSKFIPYAEYKIGEDVSRSWVVDKFPMMKTAPIILNNGGELIGGYTELVERMSLDESFGKTLLLG